MHSEFFADGLKKARPQYERTTADLHAQRLKERLSERENQVLQLLIGGFTGREIASRLNISVRTVDVYRVLINQKLDESESTFAFTRSYPPG
tara:strand:+ start:38 stop:313 length:276 start_codon:yes stop_codon:yes gene_type:complete